MLKPLSVLLVFAVAAGCVSVSAPTAAPPTDTPTLGITTMAPATPTVGATASPAASTPPMPTAVATAASEAPATAATTEPAPSATASEPPATQSPGLTFGPSPTAGVGINERDLLFLDEFTDPASGWVTGTAPDGGEVEIVDGMMTITPGGAETSLWTPRVLERNHAVVRAAGEFFPLSRGFFGLLCGASNSLYYGVAVGTNGAWAIFKLEDSVATVIESDASADLEVPIDEGTALAVDCAGTAVGDVRVHFHLESTGIVGAAVDEDAAGPAVFDRVAVYGESFSEGYAVEVEGVAAFGIGDENGEMTADGEALLQHVPADWQPTCFEGPIPPLMSREGTASLICYVEATGAEIAEYTQFPANDGMQVAYQRRIDAFGTGEGAESCADGSGEHSYDIGDTEAGRVLCVPQQHGIRFDWTDNRLNILSTLTDFDGSYSDTFDDWLRGGPNL